MLGAGAGAWAVERGNVPGRTVLHRVLGACAVDSAIPVVPTGPLRAGQFRSRFRRRRVEWLVAMPPGPPVDGQPVALVLHGRGGTARTAFAEIGLHKFLAQYVRRGGKPFAIASIDGGSAYWHPRDGGDNPLGMLIHELLPRLKLLGLRTDGFGVHGWSMGGYGSLLLARQSAAGHLAGSRVVAAAAASPALFPSYSHAREGSFDDARDFARWGDLIRDPGVSPDTALRVACGQTDPFTSAALSYRAALHPMPAGGITRGCHDHGYWRSQAAQEIAFLGEHLSA